MEADEEVVRSVNITRRHTVGLLAHANRDVPGEYTAALARQIHNANGVISLEQMHQDAANETTGRRVPQLESMLVPGLIL